MFICLLLQEKQQAGNIIYLAFRDGNIVTTMEINFRTLRYTLNGQSNKISLLVCNLPEDIGGVRCVVSVVCQCVVSADPVI